MQLSRFNTLISFMFIITTLTFSACVVAEKNADIKIVASENKERAEVQAIKETLNQFHKAAANANTVQYFQLLSDNAVFIGTDATERWTKQEFAIFVKPYFSKGRGWLYTPVEQNISLLKGAGSSNKSQTTAFFDEILHSESYGTCRGTGVLVKEASGWRIAQYSLSIPMPNALAKDFVKTIKQLALTQSEFQQSAVQNTPPTTEHK